MIFALGFLAVVLMLAVPVFVLVRAAVKGARRGLPLRRALLRPGPLSAVGALALVGAAAAAFAGWAAGFYVLDPEEMCMWNGGTYAGTTWTGIDQQVFPIRQTCTWADGRTYEMVPGWVNPVLAGFLLVALAAFIEAVVRAVGRPRPGPVDAPAAGAPLR